MDTSPLSSAARGSSGIGRQPTLLEQLTPHETLSLGSIRSAQASSFLALPSEAAAITQTRSETSAIGVVNIRQNGAHTNPRNRQGAPSNAAGNLTSPARLRTEEIGTRGSRATCKRIAVLS